MVREESNQGVEFNNYIQLAALNKTTFVAQPSEGNVNNDPISGSFTWTVTRGAIASWSVEAITNFSYYHNKFLTLSNGYEDIYNIFEYKTADAYFLGSNFTILSTYTNINTTDKVLKNNTANTTGFSRVQGTIKHVSRVQLRLPFCDSLALDRVDAVENSATFTPR